MKLKWVVKMTGNVWGRRLAYGWDFTRTPALATRYDSRDAAETALASFQTNYPSRAPRVCARKRVPRVVTP